MPTPAQPTPSLLPPSAARLWGVVGLLCLAFIIAFIDRVNLSVALADKAFVAYFKLKDTDRGLLSSAIFWTYAAVQIPAGFVVDRFGAKKSLLVGFAVWSLISAATGLAETVSGILLCRLLLGMGEAVINPAGMRWIRYNIPEQRRGMAIGLYMASAKLGPAIGTPIAAALLVAFGWRAMFLVLGTGCLLWLVPWSLLVRDNDRQLEASEIKRGRAAAVSFSAILRSPAMWGILIGTFAYQYFNYFCLTWMPSYFVERFGMSLSKSGWFTAMSYGGFAAVAIGGGFWADHLIARGGDPIRIRKIFVVSGLLLASTVLIGALSASASTAMFFSMFSLAGLGLTTANYWALTQTLIPGGSVGRLVGLQNFAANLPGIVAPLLTGWLKQSTGGYAAPLVVVAGLLVIGTGSYLVLVRPKYAPV